MIEEFPKITCKYCGNDFLQTRINKFFCCGKHRSRYHNEKYRLEEVKLISDTNALLLKNRNVLKHHHGQSEDEKIYDLKTLITSGLKTKFFIGFTVKDGRIDYNTVYDYGFKIIDNKIKIIYNEHGFH